MYMCAKLDQNTPCGSKIMIMFTKRPRPAEMMLGKASSPFNLPWLDNVYINKYATPHPTHASGTTILTRIRMRNLINICHVVQEL